MKLQLKRIPLLLLLPALLLTTAMNAQKAPVKKATGKKLIKCHIPSDTKISLKVTLEQAKAWADSVPLQVICDDLKNYKLYNFEFTLITMNPFQTKEFGTGNGGIPILARKAINNLQPKDAVILKNATYMDEKGVEQHLPPNISFSIIE